MLCCVVCTGCTGPCGRRSSRRLAALAAAMASVPARMFRPAACREGSVPGSSAAVAVLCWTQDRISPD